MKKLYTLVLCLFLTACFGGRSQTPTLYSIEALPISQTNTSFTLSVALTHIRLPKHLDRPQIVVFDSDNSQMIISEKDRWVEPMSNLLERVLTMNLSEALPRAVIKERTLANEKFDAFLSIDITELKIILDDKITLDGWWVLRDVKGKILKREKLVLSVPVSDEYSDIGKSLAELLRDISEQIAKSL